MPRQKKKNNEDEGRKNANGNKQKEKKFKALMIEEKTGTAIDLLNAYIEDIQVMRKHHFL